MDYPELFLRGIPNKKDIDEQGMVSSSVFHFGEKKNVPERTDGFHEESIFWKDNDGAVDLILNQKKDDNIQFKGGAAVVERQEVDRIRKSTNVKEQLSYERHIISDNPYHGNLLLKKTASKPLMRKIASSLALFCKEIIHQKE